MTQNSQDSPYKMESQALQFLRIPWPALITGNCSVGFSSLAPACPPRYWAFFHYYTLFTWPLPSFLRALLTLYPGLPRNPQLPLLQHILSFDFSNLQGNPGPTYSFYKLQPDTLPNKGHLLWADTLQEHVFRLAFSFICHTVKNESPQFLSEEAAT